MIYILVHTYFLRWVTKNNYIQHVICIKKTVGQVTHPQYTNSPLNLPSLMSKSSMINPRSKRSMSVVFIFDYNSDYQRPKLFSGGSTRYSSSHLLKPISIEDLTKTRMIKIDDEPQLSPPHVIWPLPTTDLRIISNERSASPLYPDDWFTSRWICCFSISISILESSLIYHSHIVD